MPTYAYYCDACSLQIDLIQKITEDALKTCPECGKEDFYRRPSGGIGLVFKGTGFYITDYERKDQARPEEKNNSKGCSENSKTCCPCEKKN